MVLVNAVLEGGGMKGFGLPGALQASVDAGIEFNKIAGTSSGAVVASLLVAGYTPEEIRQALVDLDFEKITDGSCIDSLPLVGSYLNSLRVLSSLGMYRGNYLEEWVTGLLAAKGVHTFEDLKIPERSATQFPCKLQVIISDVSHSRILVFPNDLKLFGIDPWTFSVGRAVRMSTSIPLVFDPVHLEREDGKVAHLVDGGMLSNYPVWLFDGDFDKLPTIGYRLQEPMDDMPYEVTSLSYYIYAMLNTMIDAHDEKMLEGTDTVRTIEIPTLGISTTDWHLSSVLKENLFQSGIEAGRNFFKRWDQDKCIEASNYSSSSST